MRIFLIILVLTAILGVGTQVKMFVGRKAEVNSQFQTLREKLQNASDDQMKLKGELDYYLNSINFEKELRQRFNLRSPGEKLIIIVPKNTSSPAYTIPQN